MYQVLGVQDQQTLVRQEKVVLVEIEVVQPLVSLVLCSLEGLVVVQDTLGQVVWKDRILVEQVDNTPLVVIGALVVEQVIQAVQEVIQEEMVEMVVVDY